MADINEQYVDLDYKLRKLSSGDISLVTGENAINQSLLALFNTKRGERVFMPNYGTNIPELLFEQFDEQTANIIIEEIKQGILTWEFSRIQIDSLTIDMDYDKQIYRVILDYTIKSTTETGLFKLALNKL